MSASYAELALQAIQRAQHQVDAAKAEAAAVAAALRRAEDELDVAQQRLRAQVEEERIEREEREA